MNKQVESIVFRRLTYADFRHINKRGGEEAGGGGQSYIDFPTSDVSLDNWREFLGEPTGDGTDGPFWDFSIKSIGSEEEQTLRIYQRRQASVSISSQKIHSKRANRVRAWHPDNRFPKEYDPTQAHLVIYIVKTPDQEYWAGWILQQGVPADWEVPVELRPLFYKESAGYLTTANELYFDIQRPDWPFLSIETVRENEEIAQKENDGDEYLAQEDISPALENLGISGQPPEFVERITKIKERNNKLVRNLKQLYNGRCQISGETFTFRKKDGKLYSEVHHLIPLGEEGSDSYENAIVVSPLIHRMLHYGDVSEINLSSIDNNKLPITINGKNYEIEWHPDHVKIIEESLND